MSLRDVWLAWDGEDGPVESGHILRTDEGEAVVYRHPDGGWHFEVRGVSETEKYAKKIAAYLLRELKD